MSQIQILNDRFIERYKTSKPDWGPVGEITFLRTYSRDGEEWWETCKRVVQGCYYWQMQHCQSKNQPFDMLKARHSAEQMYDLMFSMKFLPPGRGIRNMGCDVLQKTGAAANNCGFVSTANPRDAFTWCMDMLMLGVGVGFDVEGAAAEVYKPADTGTILIIDDSREGWVQALDRLLIGYLGHGIDVTFDYSQIRPKGSPINGFGGVASGPEPLREMLNDIREVLDDRAGLFLGISAVNDIMALIGRCVVSGGVRRSAEITFGPADSLEYLQLKNPEVHPGMMAKCRWASNHSVLCEPGSDYDAILEGTEGVSELGVMWLGNAQQYSRMGRRPDNKDRNAKGANPCAEQTLEHKELCCLVEVFPSRISTLYEFQKVLKYAYLYAKTVTTIPIHDKETQEIVKRNRRIGASLTGIQQALVQKGHSKFYSWCDKGYKYLKQLDERYAEWLDIPRSIKITSVKPSGSVSKLPGVFSGIHFPISEYYFQVLRFRNSSPYIERLRAAGYRCVDLSPNEPSTTAVYFPVREMYFDRGERQVSMWEQAEHAAKMQHYWADNQVSITIKHSPEERKQIPHLLRMYEDRLKSVSFFPTSDHGFAHAPWQPIDFNEYTAYSERLFELDFSGIKENDKEDKFCSGPTCEIPQ